MELIRLAIPFFFLEVGNAGDIDLVMDPVDPFTGLPLLNDLDFIAWGPFSSTANMCTQLQAVNRIDCSYSSAYSEPCNIIGANVGDQAPDFNLDIVANGNGSFQLSDHIGEIIVLAFFAPN